MFKRTHCSRSSAIPPRSLFRKPLSRARLAPSALAPAGRANEARVENYGLPAHIWPLFFFPWPLAHASESKPARFARACEAAEGNEKKPAKLSRQPSERGQFLLSTATSRAVRLVGCMVAGAFPRATSGVVLFSLPLPSGFPPPSAATSWVVWAGRLRVPRQRPAPGWFRFRSSVVDVCAPVYV